MAEAVAAGIRARTSEDRIGTAIRDALLTGLVAFLLFVVIIGLKTENAHEKLILVPRLGWAVFWAGLAMAGRLAIDLFTWRGSSMKTAGRPFLPLPTAIAGIAVAYAVGAYFFLVPDALQMAAASAADIFGAEAWKSRARITVDLVGVTLLAVFIIISAMLLVLVVRRTLSAIGLGRARAPGQSFIRELAAQFSVALLLVALVLPLLVAGPQQRYAIDTAMQVLMYIMLGWGLNIVVGLAGLLDLGYVAFYAVGAYTFGLLGTTFGWSFWVCLPLAGMFAALWGIMLGFPVLRLRGDYLAIVTLAFGEIIRVVLLNWVTLTNGPNGVSRIPRISFFGLSFDRNAPVSFHGFFGMEYDPIYRVIFMYYVILMLALIVNFATNRLRRLPIGRAWEALREDEIACRSLGINTTTTKLTAFAIGAMFAGFAGSFFATRQGFISPESFTFQESAMVLAIVVLGGLGSQLGIVIAAIVLIGTGELFRGLEEYRMLIFGASMMAIMIGRPRGLVSSRTPSVALKESRAISSSLVKEGHG
jgi:branched-chain amino acid transport system permease protein